MERHFYGEDEHWVLSEEEFESVGRKFCGFEWEEVGRGLGVLGCRVGDRFLKVSEGELDWPYNRVSLRTAASGSMNSRDVRGHRAQPLVQTAKPFCRRGNRPGDPFIYSAFDLLICYSANTHVLSAYHMPGAGTQR